jgi:RNA polymerase sigma factor (sigma-70 family)
MNNPNSFDEIKSWKDEDILFNSQEYPAVFGILVDRYHKLFLRKVYRMVKNKDDAEDVVQDAFVKIYKHAQTFTVQEGAQFSSWAYKILLNTCYTFSKKRKQEQQFFQSLDQEEMVQIQSDDRDWRQTLDMDKFVTILKRLPQTCARILSLSVLEGKSAEDVAQTEGISVETFRVRLHRAKKEFQKAVTHADI